MDIKRARQILGEKGNDLTDIEILSIINIFNTMEEALYQEYQKVVKAKDLKNNVPRIIISKSGNIKT